MTLIQGHTQEAVSVVEKWSYSQRFKFSVEKTKVVRSWYKDVWETVRAGKLTWSDHINKMDKKARWF